MCEASVARIDGTELNGTEPEGARAMPRRSELTAEQRRDGVLALLRKVEPGTQPARRFGVNEQTPYRCRDEFLADVAAVSQKSFLSCLVGILEK
jgi:hypothetical protein